MELDEVVPIHDFSNETLLALAQRLEESQSFEHQILREIELDQIWRRVDTVLRREQDRCTEAQALEALQRLGRLVFEAHDLAADDQPVEAARRLRDAMVSPARSPSP